MADTTFVDLTTVVVAEWLNECNDLVWKICSGAATLPQFWTAVGGSVNISGGTITNVTNTNFISTGIDDNAVGNVLTIDAAGDSTFTGDVLSANTKKANFTAIVAPGATDDSGAGYEVGSRWIDVTADKYYCCVDSTAAAAVWVDTTATGGGGASPYFVDDGGTPSVAPISTGTESLAIGTGSVAGGTESTAIGRSRNVGVYSFAVNIGNSTANYGISSTGTYNTAIGYRAKISATASRCFIISNDSSTNTDQTTIVGGNQQSITGASAGNSGIFSGSLNSINNCTNAVIAGGRLHSVGSGCTDSGIFSGYDSTISLSTQRAGILGGVQNIIGQSVLSSDSAIIGGGENYINAQKAVALGGSKGNAYVWGQIVHASGWFAANGDAQRSWFIARAQTTDATATEVNPNDTTSNRLILPASTAWNFAIKVVARENATQDTSAWLLEGVIKRDAANVTALVGSVTSTVIANDAGAAAWTAVVTADDTNEALIITATGEAAKTINWVASTDLIEVGN